MAYFDAVEWERSFTIKEDELRQHKQAWNPSGKGWFTNAGHENEDWAIFGPYHVEPPMPTGLFEAVFSLRARKANRTMGNPTNGRAVIDVASATDGVSGTAILASRRLTPEDMSPAQESLDGWREHSILFFYDGRQEIEFRVMKDAQQHTGVPGTTYILDFLNVKVRRLSSPARTA